MIVSNLDNKVKHFFVAHVDIVESWIFIWNSMSRALHKGSEICTADMVSPSWIFILKLINYFDPFIVT